MGWTCQDVSDLLPDHPKPDTVYRWLSGSLKREITGNDLLLLEYIAIYGLLD